MIVAHLDKAKTLITCGITPATTLFMIYITVFSGEYHFSYLIDHIRWSVFLILGICGGIWGSLVSVRIVIFLLNGGHGIVICDGYIKWIGRKYHISGQKQNIFSVTTSKNWMFQQKMIMFRDNSNNIVELSLFLMKQKPDNIINSINAWYSAKSN